jgi:hypothetical protein
LAEILRSKKDLFLYDGGSKAFTFGLKESNEEKKMQKQ